MEELAVSVVDALNRRDPDAMRDGFQDFRWEAHEIIGEPPANVVAVFRFVARGRGSGVPINLLMPQVWAFRDGKPWRNVVYPTKAEALEAAGLQQ